MAKDPKPDLSEPHLRLKAAMAARGLKSAGDLSRTSGVNESTARSHMNGFRALSKKAAQSYAVLGVSAEWLLFGRGPGLNAPVQILGGPHFTAEEKPAGEVVITVPAYSPIRPDALKLIMAYAALPAADRAGMLMRMQHPGLRDAPGGHAADAPQPSENQLYDMAEAAVDATLRTRGITGVSKVERGRLIQETVEDMLREQRAGLSAKGPVQPGKAKAGTR